MEWMMQVSSMAKLDHLVSIGVEPSRIVLPEEEYLHPELKDMYVIYETMIPVMQTTFRRYAIGAQS